MLKLLHKNIQPNFNSFFWKRMIEKSNKNQTRKIKKKQRKKEVKLGNAIEKS
jgi:hypothetical protein